MIPEGRFKTQLAEIERILEHLELLEERQANPNKSMGASHFRGMSYRQVYEECIREFAYDFRLVDQSLLLFIKSGRDAHDGHLSFSFYECPVEIMPYRAFVASELEVAPDHDSFAELMSSWGDALRKDYEEYVTSQDSKAVVTPLRFDYESTQYRPGVHPAAHMHFGFFNEIRVATRRVMNPLSFVLFLLRQRYPEHWVQFRKLKTANQLCRHVREELEKVADKYWCQEDERELALH